MLEKRILEEAGLEKKLPSELQKPYPLLDLNQEEWKQELLHELMEDL